MHETTDLHHSVPETTWDGADDEMNPRNFSSFKKFYITILLSLLAESASMGSSIFAPASPYFSRDFGISTEVGTLATSLYVLGFAFGPLFWAPMSEVYGRRLSLIPACLAMACFSIGSALSRNPQTLFFMRFLEGVCGSAPVSNVSAAIGDVYSARSRATAGAFYASAVVGGPTLGPIIGSAVSQSRLGWRWCGWIEAIWMAFTTGLAICFLPELYAPVLLERKAKRLREAGDENAWHSHEAIVSNLTFRNLFVKQCGRPITMLFTEPIVSGVALYASFTYATLYFALEAVPFVFEDIRGYNPLVGSLPFLAILIGVICAIGIVIAGQGYYARTLDRLHVDVAPEARTLPMFVGALLLPIGLYMFAWTGGYRSVPWIVPSIAAGIFGAGFAVVFQTCIMVLVDSYGPFAASAVSANTFLRSIMAAGFPLSATPLLRRIGFGPAISIVGGIAVIAIPVPIVLKYYGKALRRRSQYTEE